MDRGNPVRLWVPRWPSNHFSQFDLLIFSLYATIARSLDILVRIAEWRIGCVWPVAPVTTIWEIIHTREHRTPPHPYQHFWHCPSEGIHTSGQRRSTLSSAMSVPPSSEGNKTSSRMQKGSSLLLNRGRG